MVSKVDYQTYTSGLESHWVPHSYGFVPHLSKKLSKLLFAVVGNIMVVGALTRYAPAVWFKSRTDERET